MCITKIRLENKHSEHGTISRFLCDHKWIDADKGKGCNSYMVVECFECLFASVIFITNAQISNLQRIKENSYLVSPFILSGAFYTLDMVYLVVKLSLFFLRKCLIGQASRFCLCMIVNFITHFFNFIAC